MKAILITGYHYNESVRVVDVKETEKSYMADGIRFRKGFESGGQIGYVFSTKYDEAKRLYLMNDETAKSKLDRFNHEKLNKKIHDVVCRGITKDQAKAIAEILGL